MRDDRASSLTFSTNTSTNNQNTNQITTLSSPNGNTSGPLTTKPADIQGPPSPQQAVSQQTARTPLENLANQTGIDNPLDRFASYNYIITLAGLPKSIQPNKRFTAADITNIISRTAGDWGNEAKRVPTAFGKFDYFIEDLSIKSIFGFTPQTGNSFATDIEFKIVEPYSMGLFLLAMQSAAILGGYGDNYRDSPFILMIQWVGFTDTADTTNLAREPNFNPDLTRFVPIRIVDVKFKVTQAGTIYNVRAIPYNEIGFQEQYQLSFSDVQVIGNTVGEMLKDGDASLEKQIKERFKNIQKLLELSSIDDVRIDFPQKYDSAEGTSNEISISKMFFDLTDNGTGRFPSNSDAYNDVKKIYENAKVEEVGVEKLFHWKQGAKIQEMINEVVIRSDYITNQIKDGTFKTDSNGMMNWFRVEMHIEDKEQNLQLNRPNRLLIFRVVPFRIHVNKLLPPKVQAPGLNQLVKEVKKVYNYIYTGKNNAIMNFDIDFNFAFFTALPADGTNNTSTENRNQGGITAGTNDPAITFYKNELNLNLRTASSAALSVFNTVSNQNYGSSSSDTFRTIQVKTFRNIIENQADLLDITFEILGDPYFVPSSGMGNQLVPQTSFNMLQDGSMNYQSGEVDIIINFRTPIDIDLNTGLYNFDAEVDMFSGLYKVIESESRFIQGKFTNVIRAQRRLKQDEGENNSSTPFQQGTGVNVNTGVPSRFDANSPNFSPR